MAEILTMALQTTKYDKLPTIRHVWGTEYAGCMKKLTQTNTKPEQHVSALVLAWEFHSGLVGEIFWIYIL
jgi:hypothetical protein